VPVKGSSFATLSEEELEDYVASYQQEGWLLKRRSGIDRMWPRLPVAPLEHSTIRAPRR